jgi:hypothetical protein
MALQPLAIGTDALRLALEGTIARLMREETTSLSAQEIVETTVDLASLSDQDADDFIRMYWGYTRPILRFARSTVRYEQVCVCR